VQAAKAREMSAVGLARADDYDLLAAAHPDIVVTTLDDVDLQALREGPPGQAVLDCVARRRCRAERSRTSSVGRHSTGPAPGPNNSSGWLSPPPSQVSSLTGSEARVVTSSAPIARQVFLSSSRAKSDQRDGKPGRDVDQ